MSRTKEHVLEAGTQGGFHPPNYYAGVLRDPPEQVEQIVQECLHREHPHFGRVCRCDVDVVHLSGSDSFTVPPPRKGIKRNVSDGAKTEK